MKTIDCMHQTGPTGRKLERLGMSPICSTIAMSVTVSVTVSKMEIILHQTWSQKQQYSCDILLSQQMLDVMKHVIDDNFIFQQDSALMLIAFNTGQLLQCKTPIFLFFWAVAPKWSRA